MACSWAQQAERDGVKGRMRVCKCVRVRVCSSGRGEVREYEGNLREGLRSPAVSPPRYTYVFYAEAGRWSPPPPLLPSTLSRRTPASTLVSLLLLRSGPSLRGPFSTQQHRNDGRDGGGGNLTHIITF